MTSPHSTESLWDYLQDCLKLVYWTYFKPFTFKQYLQNIHPNLDITTNPFQFSDEFSINPELKRYADQVARINLVLPFIVTILVAIPYTLFSEQSFKWFISVLFLAGWSLGILLATYFTAKLQERFVYIYLYFILILFAWQADWLPKLILLLPHGNVIIDYLIALFANIKIIEPLAVGVAFGVAVGVAFGVAVGVAFGVVAGVA